MSLWRVAAAMHKGGIGIFLFDQFQIGLPPDWIAIILPAKVGIDPVGCQTISQRCEEPP
jgi:hypothetical protein